MQPADLLAKFGSRLTEAERDAIARGDVSMSFIEEPKGQPREPLPPGVAGAVAHLQKQMVQQDVAHAQAAEKAAHSVVVPELTDISKLTPEQQATELAALGNMLDAQDKREIPPVAIPDNPMLAKLQAQKVPEPPPKPAENKPEELASLGHVCKNCRWPASRDPLEVSVADKRQWLRSVLGGQPFVKTYTIMGGQLSVTFRSRSKSVQSLIDTQIQREMLCGRLIGGDFAFVASVLQKRLGQLTLAAALVTYTGLKGQQLPALNTKEALELYSQKTYDGLEDKVDRPRVDEPAQLKDTIVAKAYLQLFGDSASNLEDVLLQQLYQFEALQTRLRTLSLAEDFLIETPASA